MRKWTSLKWCSWCCLDLAMFLGPVAWVFVTAKLASGLVIKPAVILSDITIKLWHQTLKPNCAILFLPTTTPNLVTCSFSSMVQPWAHAWLYSMITCFMADLEQHYLSSVPCAPLVYLRYIDDIFIVWTDGKESLDMGFDNLSEEVCMLSLSVATYTRIELCWCWKCHWIQTRLSHLFVKSFFSPLFVKSCIYMLICCHSLPTILSQSVLQLFPVT